MVVISRKSAPFLREKDLSVIPGLTGNLGAGDAKRARRKGRWRDLERGLARFRALLERA